MARRRSEKIIEESGLDTQEWSELIDRWVFNELHRKILKRQLLDGLSFEELAEEFNYSVNGIKDIVYKAQNKLFSKLKI